MRAEMSRMSRSTSPAAPAAFASMRFTFMSDELLSAAQRASSCALWFRTTFSRLRSPCASCALDATSPSSSSIFPSSTAARRKLRCASARSRAARFSSCPMARCSRTSSSASWRFWLCASCSAASFCRMNLSKREQSFLKVGSWFTRSISSMDEFADSSVRSSSALMLWSPCGLSPAASSSPCSSVILSAELCSALMSSSFSTFACCSFARSSRTVSDTPGSSSQYRRRRSFSFLISRYALSCSATFSCSRENLASSALTAPPLGPISCSEPQAARCVDPGVRVPGVRVPWVGESLLARLCVEMCKWCVSFRPSLLTVGVLRSDAFGL
mmetsp:Transcript_37614/g.117593  ORF Transcript_37614/g.117593 Transcript_37614/m.117593 type:complete len:328 (+) Transcript_37614:490-1473(+)